MSQPLTTSSGAHSDLKSREIDALLDALDTDAVRAAERYEECRSRLIRFFIWVGALHPEELADRSLDRAAKKIAEGVTLTTADPYRFISGVAGLVLKEALRKESRERTAQKAWTEYLRQISGRSLEPDDHRLEHLKACLATLSDSDRKLILKYHMPIGSQIVHRREVAKSRGITVNNLRVQIYRIKRRLRNCLASVIGGEV